LKNLNIDLKSLEILEPKKLDKLEKIKQTLKLDKLTEEEKNIFECIFNSSYYNNEKEKVVFNYLFNEQCDSNNPNQNEQHQRLIFEFELLR